MSLTEAYQHYLQSQLSPEAVSQLIDALETAGLRLVAEGLRQYFHDGNQSFSWTDSTWGNRKCYVGKDTPKAQYGDLWLDIVELTPMIYIPARSGVAPESKGWIAIHPVQIWQFHTFLNLVKWRGDPNMESIKPQRLMDKTRFDTVDELNCVTNVYHEEASAYSMWYYKMLAGYFTLSNALDFLTTEQITQILPSKLWAWDIIQHQDESMREINSFDAGFQSIKNSDAEEIYKGNDLTYLLFDRSTDDALPWGNITTRLVYEFIVLKNTSRQIIDDYAK